MDSRNFVSESVCALMTDSEASKVLANAFAYEDCEIAAGLERYHFHV